MRAALKKPRVWEAGMSFRAIGEQVGISTTQAHTLVKAVLARISDRVIPLEPEVLADLVERQRMRLDRAYSRQERIIARAEQLGDVKEEAIIVDRAIRSQLRTLEREARLLKLDRQDDAESVGKAVGTSISDELRTMSRGAQARARRLPDGRRRRPEDG
jgi:uncharacterized protein (DUF2267 family)